MTDRTMTICWLCKNTNRYDCTWFDPDDPKPVEGWVVEESEVNFGRQRTDVSYTVKSCPNFKREENRVVEIDSGHPGIKWSGEDERWVLYEKTARGYRLVGRFDRFGDAVIAQKEAKGK